MKLNIEKYKWYILGYIFYISVVHLCISKERPHVYKDDMVLYGITIPLIIYFIYALIKYRKENKRWPLVKIFSKQDDVLKNEAQDKLNDREDVYKPNLFSEAWPFVKFVDLYGPKIEIATRVDNKTNKSFKTCDISDTKGKTISIRFDYSLGELSPEQIQSRKDNLFVIKTYGIYYLVEYKNPYLKK